MSARRRAAAGACALALVAAASACGVTRDGKARVIAPADVPFKLTESTTTTTTVPPTTTTVEATTTTVAPVTTTAVPTESVRLYFVQGGDRIGSELRSVPVADGAPVNVERVLDQLVTAPRGTPGATTLIVPGVLGGFEGVANGTMTLDLGETYLALTPAQQVLALGQIVLTVTKLPGVGRVQFRYANQNATVWRGDTSTTDGEVSGDNYRVLLAP